MYKWLVWLYRSEQNGRGQGTFSQTAAEEVKDEVWTHGKLAYLLADRTNSHAYGTMFCPSVVCLSVTFCIVAKQYVVEGRRWYRWIGRW